MDGERVLWLVLKHWYELMHSPCHSFPHCSLVELLNGLAENGCVDEENNRVFLEFSPLRVSYPVHRAF